MTTAEFDEKYGNLEVTISAAEMAHIVRDSIDAALKACPTDTIDSLVFSLMLADVLATFGARIMSEMYQIDDTLEIDNDKE